MRRKTKNKQRIIVAAVICPEYCRYGVKHYVTINHSNCHRRNCYSSIISDYRTEIQHLDSFYTLLCGAFGRMLTTKRSAVTKLSSTFENLLLPANRLTIVVNRTRCNGQRQNSKLLIHFVLYCAWIFVDTKYMEISNLHT